MDQSESEPHLRSNFIYPVLFLYWQSLELHLKYLLMAYGPLAGETPDIRSHDLKSLWSKCKRAVQFFEGDIAEPVDKDIFQAIEDRIAEFDAVDSRSDASRFAHDTIGRPMKLPICAVDLPNLRKVVASLHNFFEYVDWQLQYDYDLTACEH